MLRSVDPGLAPTAVAGLIALSAGNPLGLLELPGALTDAQRAGVEAVGPGTGVTSRLVAVFGDRIRRLPAPARLATVAAAAADPADACVLPAALAELGLPPDCLDAAEADGLLRLGDEISFRHPLVRLAALGSSSGADRRRVEGALAQAVGDPERRLWHRAAAVPTTDDQLATELEQLASAAGRRAAYSSQSRMLAEAARLTTGSARRATRLVDAAHAAWRGGSPRRSDDLLTAAEVIDAAATSTTTGLLARLRVLRWRGVSALVDVIERAVAVSDAAPDDIAVTALRQAAIQRLMIADPAPAVAHARAALTRAAGDPWLRFLGHEACALSYTQSGLVEQARTHGRAAVALIDGGYGHPDHICTLASALNWCELYADVRRVLAADVDRHRRAGNPHFLVTGLLYLGEMLLRIGDLSAAEPVAREAVEVASRLGDRYLGPMSAALLGYLRVLRGEQDGMRLAREAASAPGDLGMRVITVRPLARALLLAGDPAGALAALAPVIQVEPRGYREPNEIRGVGLRLEALVATGRLDEAHGVLAHVEAAAQGSSTRWTRACAARFRGVLAEDLDEAEVAFGQALSALADEDGPLERGLVLLDQGRRLRRGGRRRDAREVLQAAHTDFTACGARPFAAQAAREMAGTAARLRPRGEPAGVQLTAREAQVARHAAAGATDREIAAALFVSARTVDFHLRNVFRKLGLRTRGELAGRLSDGDIAPSEP